jgi:hypothetical protein
MSNEVESDGAMVVVELWWRFRLRTLELLEPMVFSSWFLP